MKIMIDLNIFIDVFQKRDPHFDNSSLLLSKVLNGNLPGFIAGHAVTTLNYLLSRFSGNQKAMEVIDWVLANFEVESADKKDFLHARTFGMKDFEDAVVASCAVNAKCDYIVTRNIKDFKQSPIQPVTPANFLEISPLGP
jgi:predicted nucleic acid-binding protein